MVETSIEKIIRAIIISAKNEVRLTLSAEECNVLYAYILGLIQREEATNENR